MKHTLITMIVLLWIISLLALVAIIQSTQMGALSRELEALYALNSRQFVTFEMDESCFAQFQEMDNIKLVVEE